MRHYKGNEGRGRETAVASSVFPSPSVTTAPFLNLTVAGPFAVGLMAILVRRHWAGAELIDMEFVQFHPTGMVWPPSIRGTLITEGVRGEGGVLKNSDGKRFMFDNVPDLFKGDFAETEDEADRWVEAVVAARRPEARRPPELLTRDVVARAIRREILEGRGSPHGGVFLDIASRRSAEAIKKKLPGMYHQFKELAGVDITKEAMEVGPTTHYIMGGVDVDGDTQMSAVPGLFACGEVAAGLLAQASEGGHLTRADFQSYTPKWRQPVEITRGQARIAVNPPPALGGVLVAFALGQVPNFNRQVTAKVT